MTNNEGSKGFCELHNNKEQVIVRWYCLMAVSGDWKDYQLCSDCVRMLRLHGEEVREIT